MPDSKISRDQGRQNSLEWREVLEESAERMGFLLFFSPPGPRLLKRANSEKGVHVLSDMRTNDPSHPGKQAASSPQRQPPEAPLLGPGQNHSSCH